jgi:hypothetical protein
MTELGRFVGGWWGGWGFVGFFFGFAGGVEVLVIVVRWLGALGEGEGLGDAFIRGLFGVGTAIADGESGLVLGDGFGASGRVLGVVEAAEVDVAPGHGAGVFAELEGFFEALGGFVGVAFHEIDASEDVGGAAVVRGGVGEGLFGEIGGSARVTFHEVEFGEVHAVEGAGLGMGVERIRGGLFEEEDLFSVAALAVEIHAVDHGSDLVAKAVAVVLHDAEAVVEVLGEDPALALVEGNEVVAGDGGLGVVGSFLEVVSFEFGAGPGTGESAGRRRGDDVHVRFDGLDEALGDEGDDVALVGELERSVLDATEKGLEALHGLAAAVDLGFDQVVEIDVADLFQVDGNAGGVVG